MGQVDGRSELGPRETKRWLRLALDASIVALAGFEVFLLVWAWAIFEVLPKGGTITIATYARLTAPVVVIAGLLVVRSYLKRSAPALQ